MTKRVILIILAAVAFALLIGFLWFWFFSGKSNTQAPAGSFGTGQDRQGGTSGAGTTGNVATNITGVGGGTTGATNVGVAVNPYANSTGGGVAPAQGIAGAPGVDWLGGDGSASGGNGGTGRPTTSFVPSGINQLDGGVDGTPYIVGTGFSDQGSNNGLGLGLGGLFGAAAGCAVLFATSEAPANADASARGAASLAGGFVLTYDFNAYKQRSQNQFKDVSDCLARTIAKAVIQQMTNSIVNWINSGFNGKPSFVQNFQQFFTNVGDQAAGEFIKGTALSFLCSPFKNQIRIAIAQSYAQRNAGSCSLTGIVKNLTGFMNGNFSQGGWPGLLQFTTMPTNNPFGAYAYAQVGLATAQQNALTDANRNLSPGGFISVKKCDPPGSTNCKVSTPSALVESSLKETLKQPFLANQLAKSFDEIINALLNQLVTRTLYQGLSSLSGQNGYASSYLTPAEQQAQADAQTLLTKLQNLVQTAQQFGSVEQASISDIQSTQQKLQDLFNCYDSKGDSQHASSTQEIINNYQVMIAMYNNYITRANQTIALLQDLQTRTISVASPADVAAVTSSFQQAQAAGAFITDADVTTATQDRTTLQSNLSGRNSITQGQLAACYAQ